MNDLYFCGDIHGEYRKLVWTLCEKNKLQDSSVVILGDFGVGFTKPKELEIEYKRSEPKLEKNNLTIYVLRGNHDDPDYFKDTSRDFPRLKFLQDHTVYNICDRSIYIIGGAYSTDANLDPNYEGEVEDRKVETEKRLRKGKLPTWWPGECVEKKYTDLPNRVDIIASHTAPISFDPVSIRTSEISLTQFENIVEERKYLQYILLEVRADYWFYGHYHKNYTGTYNQLLYKGLGVLELSPAPEHKQTNPQGELKDE